MDSYRGQLVDREGADFDSPDLDDDLAEDEIGHEPPPVSIGQDERRMQVRAYNHWASLLGDRNFPQIEDLIAAEAPDFADNAVVLDFTKGIENPAVTMLGAKLAEECGATKAIKKLSDVPGRSLLSRITDHYMQILANQAPIGFEAEFVNQRGTTVLYRGILLPFSSDGENIQHIQGVINWKEVADQAITEELIREIDRTLGAEKTLRAEKSPRGEKTPRLKRAIEPTADSADAALSAPLAEWADGPITDDAPGLAAPGEDWGLSDWLASARELAQLASGTEDRSRAALYAAISRAWDFALAADFDPHAFRGLVADAGLSAQARAPMTPVVKLVFGADYDKTRLTEYASALVHARRQGLERGKLAEFLAQAPGGLKGVVCEERKLRRAEAGKSDADKAPHDTLLGKLRALPSLALKDISVDGSEFAVVLLRRLPGGKLRLLGEVSDDIGLLERTAKHVLRQGQAAEVSTD